MKKGPRFAKPCDKCEKDFVPTGKFCVTCEVCILERANERKLKRCLKND